MKHLYRIHLDKKPVWLLLIGLFIFSYNLHAEIKVHAVIEPNPVTLGQSTILKVVVEGTQKAEPPEIQNNEYLEFAYRGPNTQVSWVNGNLNATITHVYQVRPLRTGKFKIPGLVMFIEGKNYKTNDIIIEVSEKTESSLDVNEIAYLEFDVPARDVYVGETISSELRMVMLKQANFTTRNLPRIEGDAFSITPIDNEPQMTRAVKNGRYYDVYAWKIGITPVKAGVQTLQFKAPHILRIPEGNSNARRDPFSVFRNDPFFDNMFGRYKDVEILSESAPADISIQSLPTEGQPESFNGAIGNFTAISTTDTRNLSEGDPITLKIEVKGEGNFSQMSPPQFPDSENFKTYPPRVVEESLDTQGYAGSKQFEFVVIPLSTDVTEVPPIPFSYFNPRTGKYSEMNTPKIPISIKPFTKTLGSTQEPQFKNPQLTFRNNGNGDVDLLLPIKVSLGNIATPPTLKRMQNTLTLSVVAPLGILGLAYLVRRTRHSSQKDVERLRLKELDKKTAVHREGMRTARKNNDLPAFYQAACRVLQVALARQLGCNPEAITGKEINALWVPSLGDDHIRESIENFFQKVDALRYSGGATSEGTLEKEELELESILRQLGKK